MTTAEAARNARDRAEKSAGEVSRVAEDTAMLLTEAEQVVRELSCQTSRIVALIDEMSATKRPTRVPLT